MTNLFEQDHSGKFLYQDKNPEIKAILTKLKVNYPETSIKQMSRLLGGTFSIEALCCFHEGAGTTPEQLKALKKLLNWNPQDTEKYLKICQQRIDEQQVKTKPYIPTVPDGELEARDKDSARWERFFIE